MAAEEIPGARDELRRRGERLYAELAALLDALAPGLAPDVPLPEHPDIVSWGNPLGFAYYRQVSFDRPRAAPGELERAELLLAAWRLTRERTESGSVVLHAERGGMKLRLHFHPQRGLTLCRADTEPMFLHHPEEFVRPEPLITAANLPGGYRICPTCDGLALCDRCWGRGWTMGGHTWVIGRTEGRTRCGECHGSRFCPVCRGLGYTG